MADNPLDDTDPARQQRIRERAYALWETDGRPEGRDLEFWERARELIGMEEHSQAGLLPNPVENQGGESEAIVEEAEIQDNLGEFPDRLADQGDWRQTPVPRHSPRRHKEDSEPRPKARHPS